MNKEKLLQTITALCIKEYMDINNISNFDSFIENNKYRHNCSILNDMYNIKDNFKPIVIDVNKDIVPIKEDEIPLPVTGDIIDDEQNLTDEDYELDTESN